MADGAHQDIPQVGKFGLCPPQRIEEEETQSVPELRPNAHRSFKEENGCLVYDVRTVSDSKDHGDSVKVCFDQANKVCQTSTDGIRRTGTA